LGIDADSVVVVYDRLGVYSSPRARWMLKAMGHERTAVLDGGFSAWLEKGYPRESRGESAAATGDFFARPRRGAFRDMEFVAKAMSDPGCAIIDARSEGRFYGREPEPRKDLRSGHIPGSKNLPFERVLDGASFRTPQELKVLFREMDVSPEKKLIFSCGSGVTACIAALAAEIAGCPNISVYDGSWSEWGLPSDRPVSVEGDRPTCRGGGGATRPRRRT
jgi:thiosulfate/3-mercaptopyruvate sulfurtransferase